MEWISTVLQQAFVTYLHTCRKIFFTSATLREINCCKSIYVTTHSSSYDDIVFVDWLPKAAWNIACHRHIGKKNNTVNDDSHKLRYSPDQIRVYDLFSGGALSNSVLWAFFYWKQTKNTVNHGHMTMECCNCHKGEAVAKHPKCSYLIRRGVQLSEFQNWVISIKIRIRVERDLVHLLVQPPA